MINQTSSQTQLSALSFLSLANISCARRSSSRSSMHINLRAPPSVLFIFCMRYIARVPHQMSAALVIIKRMTLGGENSTHLAPGRGAREEGVCARGRGRDRESIRSRGMWSGMGAGAERGVRLGGQGGGWVGVWVGEWVCG